MDEPIVVLLSPANQARFAALDAEIASAQARRSDWITLLIAQAGDPGTPPDWSVSVFADRILVTPPVVAPPPDAEPA